MMKSELVGKCLFTMNRCNLPTYQERNGLG